ncbi:energy transducer TonB [Gammaproteobacteria bacterium]|jgi:protein TonB|nr:energy transducer TonB [Gammaproteobacteria bacterium]|tara:strand:- start:4486 stop:5115 length:630 start_codon:yes stop_codon:yes gene_type:complete
MYLLQQIKTNKNTFFIAGGLSSAFVLFLFMYLLILPGDLDINALKDRQMVDFIRMKKDDTLNERDRRLPDKPPPPKRPPPPELETPDVQALPTPKLDIKFPDIKMPIDTDGAFVGGGKYLGDGGLVPLVRITPRYPRNALLKNQEGVVVIELLVDEGGSVVTAKIINANPPGVFNAAAIQAVLKWKFKPRVLNGIAIQQRGLTTIEFII